MSIKVGLICLWTADTIGTLALLQSENEQLVTCKILLSYQESVSTRCKFLSENTNRYGGRKNENDQYSEGSRPSHLSSLYKKCRVKFVKRIIE